jgi:hypothetical protein
MSRTGSYLQKPWNKDSIRTLKMGLAMFNLEAAGRGAFCPEALKLAHQDAAIQLTNSHRLLHLFQLFHIHDC